MNEGKKWNLMGEWVIRGMVRRVGVGVLGEVGEEREGEWGILGKMVGLRGLICFGVMVGL